MYSKLSLFKGIFVAVVAAIGAQAAPGAAMADLGAREADTAAVDGHLFVCVNANFGAPCNNFNFNNGQCINFVAPFQDSISSLGPDPGFTCIVFKDANCSGQSFNVANPGITDLSSTGLNDQLSSFQCFTN
ncbi:hypothetical protein CVT25_006270 [Psilocybe cyanescens]|uniref:Uncharacterized protein n=1 Tax=Psilocybe cyanescens TaxID=93625 RepID=A0A409WYQ9_PSICY|nr:hypothetical protein CVT25_006270 [Psilocybe cyanescens]